MILILTNAQDTLPPLVTEALQKKKAAFARFDTPDFPRTHRVTIRFDDYAKCNDAVSLLLSDVNVDIRKVTSVWYRRPAPPIADPALTAMDQDFVVAESMHVLNSVWYLLGDKFWVNPYEAGRAAEHKPYQLQVARMAGLEIPRTLVTNEPEAVLAFFETCSNGMIYKTLRPHSRRERDTPLALFTNRVTRERLERHLRQITLGPCLFQEYVPKRCELRVNVVGHRIFTSAIDSQCAEYSKDDWRKHILVERLPQTPFQLPAAIESKVHDLMGRLGLVFGCLDMILTPDDQYVFLEANPNGQWFWVERDTGLPLLDNFTEMLIQSTPAYGVPV